MATGTRNVSKDALTHVLDNVLVLAKDDGLRMALQNAAICEDPIPLGHYYQYLAGAHI
jgi:hypothetical protein